MAEDRPIRCPTRSSSAVSWRKLTDHKQSQTVKLEEDELQTRHTQPCSARDHTCQMPAGDEAMADTWRCLSKTGWDLLLVHNPGLHLFPKVFSMQTEGSAHTRAQAPHKQGIPLSHRQLWSLAISSNEETKEEILFFCASPQSPLIF